MDAIRNPASIKNWLKGTKAPSQTKSPSQDGSYRADGWMAFGLKCRKRCPWDTGRPPIISNLNPTSSICGGVPSSLTTLGNNMNLILTTNTISNADGGVLSRTSLTENKKRATLCLPGRDRTASVSNVSSKVSFTSAASAVFAIDNDTETCIHRRDRWKTQIRTPQYYIRKN